MLVKSTCSVHSIGTLKLHLHQEFILAIPFSVRMLFFSSPGIQLQPFNRVARHDLCTYFFSPPGIQVQP